MHAKSSARKFGGIPEDYVKLHDFLDSSKTCLADNRHRALTHNSWFIGPGGPLELAFGHNIVNSAGKLVSVRDLGEQHILEDFGGKFIPSASDYLNLIENQSWIHGSGGIPPSCVNLFKNKITKTISLKDVGIND